MKIKLFHFLLMASFFLVSCKGDTSRQRVIQNNTGGFIVINAVFTNGETYNSVLMSGSSVTILTTIQTEPSDFITEPSDEIDSMVIINSLSDTLLKDYKLQSNWSNFADEVKKNPETWRHTYTFSVNDIDF